MTALTNTQIDRKCAGIMGWIIINKKAGINRAYYDDNEFGTWIEDWHPSTDLNHVHRVEEKLMNCGLWLKYFLALRELTSLPDSLLIHVESRKRCEAAIQAWEWGK